MLFLKEISLLGLIVFLAACGGGGGGSGGNPPPPTQPPSGAVTFTVEATAISMSDAASGMSVDVQDLPFQGHTVTLN
jgi:hypothetical protein